MYIGLLEDEPHLAQHVCEILEGAGHTVKLTALQPDGMYMHKS